MNNLNIPIKQAAPAVVVVAVSVAVAVTPWQRTFLLIPCCSGTDRELKLPLGNQHLSVRFGYLGSSHVRCKSTSVADVWAGAGCILSRSRFHSRFQIPALAACHVSVPA